MALCNGTADGVAPDDIAVKAGAEFRDALLRLVIYVAESESPGIAESPFEVIEQAPAKVAPHGISFRHRTVKGDQMLLKVHGAGSVPDFVLGVGAVGIGRAVFRDVNGGNIPELRGEPRHPVENGGGPMQSHGMPSRG